MPYPRSDESDLDRNEDDTDYTPEQLRQKKAHIEDYREITMLRQRSAKAAAIGAKFKTRMRDNEAKMVKYTHMSVSQRHRSKMYVEKKKACEGEKEILDQQLKESGLDIKYRAKLEVKKAKLIEKAAKMQQKSAQAEAKAATYTNKSTLYQQKAAEFEKKAKEYELDAKEYAKRADKLESLMG